MNNPRVNFWLEKIARFLPFGRKKSRVHLPALTDETTEAQELWWGTFSIEEEQSRFFKIGNIVICVDRFHHKWHITTYREGEQPFKTFAAQTSNEIHLKPALPDRALLSQLDRPIYIPVGKTVLIYISSPLWIRIEAGNPSTLLDEFATETLADTWFGKNTLDGEICYANHIQGSPRLEDLPRETTHVITPVSIENRSRETLLLQELKIPLPYLSIYSDKQNHLWTDQLNIYQEDPRYIETVVVQSPPLPLKDIHCITTPRLVSKPGFKNLFSPFMWK